jgi:cyclase
MSDFAKRIIPCLDIDKGRVVKGINFIDIVDAGDPVESAIKYNNLGADELVFLDITATHEKRDTVTNIVKEVAKEVFIPFTVGGGISSLNDIYNLLNAGCDKVSINSMAVKNPSFIEEASKRFGSSCITIAIDIKNINGKHFVFTAGGRINENIDAFLWAKKAEELGAGEILLTSMDKDGTKNGYDLEILNKISSNINIPVIASGGAGSKKHIKEAFENGADATLAASIFHFGEIEIMELKRYLQKEGISVRV